MLSEAKHLGSEREVGFGCEDDVSFEGRILHFAALVQDDKRGLAQDEEAVKEGCYSDYFVERRQQWVRFIPGIMIC